MKFNFQKTKSILLRFNNRYLIAGVIFLVWVGFLDKNNLISQYDLVSELKDLRKERDFYKNEVTRDSIQIRRLQKDPGYLEKFGRETYLMKREEEDVFLMVDTTVIKVEK